MLDKKSLVRKADEARKNSYCPYSGMSVGAALLDEAGEVYLGVNIENASFPCGICAERSALAAAVSAGKRRFSAIAVSGGRRNEPPTGFTPCGACRQALFEFCEGDMPVLIARGEGFDEYTLSSLLPYSFDKDKLD